MSDSATEPTQAQRAGAVTVAAITVALVAWPIAFNLGAYDAVFYTDVFTFVVIATTALAITAFADRGTGRGRILPLVGLALPGLWLAGAVTFFDSTAQAATDGLYGLLGLAVALVAVPIVLRMVARLFVPELTDRRDRRVVGYAIGVLIVIAISGYIVGANNDAFLTCGDFKVAGADEPPNCAR